MRSCLNCDAPLRGDYCGRCGQRDIDLDRPIQTLLGEFTRETFEIDGRSARTLWTLFRSPGELTSAYLAGRRRSYTPPLRLYLVISVLFFVITAWVAGRGILLSENQTLESDALGQARLFADELPRLMFVLLPVFALLLKLAFRARLYINHLIHALHLHSAAYLLLMLVMPLERAAEENLLILAIQAISFAYLLAYLIMSLRRVYGEGWLATSAKTAVVLLAYAMLVVVSVDGLSMLPSSDSIQ